jgi:L-alanine-DL-glutamate epimerase-like enolase superfamily enzyme
VTGIYEHLAALPLRVDGYRLEPLERQVSSGFTRRTTVVVLESGGETGIGEDVTYDPAAHVALAERPADLPLAGDHTIDSFSELVGALDLFPEGAGMPASLDYRRWAFESAALDLALRQAGRSLAVALGRTPRPVSFVVSMRLPEPVSAAAVVQLLERYPGTRFKLDPTSAWTEELAAELAATGAVESVDLKGAYRGTVVDQPPDPALYRLVAGAFPDAWIEDPALTPETEPALDGARDRITWDAVIHSVADIEALPFPPRAINIKPSRFGSVRRLVDAYDHCAERGIAPYGGGQFELGPGRGQVQYLASLFHPDAPNDVAPGGYNQSEPLDGLPQSPLPVAASEVGFRWGE